MLQPRQLGSLAAHVKSVLDQFPHEEIDLNVKVEKLKRLAAGGEFQMEPWEVELKKLVDGDPNLPDYDSLTNESEMLMGYYDQQE